VSVVMPPRTSVGSTIDYVVDIHNASNSWSSMAHCTHLLGLGEGITFRVDALPPHGSARINLQFTALQRGIATASTAEFVTTAPLGLRQRKRSVDIPLRLIVHPMEVPVVVPPPRAGADSTEWQLSRSGTDVHGIREWRPGDEASQVHWRSSARRGRLVVLEREIPKAGGLALLLAADSPLDDWEAVVAVGAWTGATAVRAGREVLLVADVGGGAEQGPDDATTILDWCAQSKAALPTAEQLRGAFAFAGRGGDVAVAAGPAAYAGWWQWAAGLAAAHDIDMVRLSCDADLAETGC